MERPQKMKIRQAGEGEMGPKGEIEIKVWKAGG